MSCINLPVSAIRHYSVLDTLHRIWLQEHTSSYFNFALKSATKNHVYSCSECIEKHFNVYDFTILKKCHTRYEAKIEKEFGDKIAESKIKPSIVC